MNMPAIPPELSEEGAPGDDELLRGLVGEAP